MNTLTQQKTALAATPQLAIAKSTAIIVNQKSDVTNDPTVSYAKNIYKERIIVSGGPYSKEEVDNNKYYFEFIDSALKETTSSVEQKSGIRTKTTLLIFNERWKSTDLDIISDYETTYNFNTIMFTTSDELISYINNGSDVSRDDCKITNFVLFSHGVAKALFFSCYLDLNNDGVNDIKEKFDFLIEDIDRIDNSSFEKTFTEFFSCNTATNIDGVELSSFANKWTQKTQGITKAYRGKSSYYEINKTGWNFIAKGDYKDQREAIVGTPIYSKPYPAFRRPISASRSKLITITYSE